MKNFARLDTKNSVGHNYHKKSLENTSIDVFTGTTQTHYTKINSCCCFLQFMYSYCVCAKFHKIYNISNNLTTDYLLVIST